MKKRMIAWLLCACMTLTAAPEMLLADVAGNAQQTQEENSFKEKGTVETQTVEQDDEKSAVTEKTETDQAGEEDHNARRLAEEESGAAGTEIVTEETEEPETTIVTEETEEPETKVVTEETEETETENVTEEPEQAETENVTEETERTEEILKRALSGDEISRIDWVQELVTLFDLTVDEDNYPDNYYSDISTDDSFYRDVMVACEFGMIDLEAGEEFRPEDAVTREFAAQTMNAMLGFVPETDSYTYQDTADVTYKEAAQIAIDRGWVTVAAGKFLPEQSLTTEEHDAMIADAKKVLADAQIETGKENTCTFASGVVVVPKGTAVSIDVDGIVMIENCPVTIKQGTTFAVYVNDIVMAYKAESVRTDGTTTYITTSDADDGAVLNVDQQGELDVDMTEFIPADEETYVVNGVTVTEGMTRGISYKNNTLRADKTISVSDDVTATVSVVISNMKVNYSLNNNDYYFSVSGDMEYSCNVKGDAFKNINHTLTLGAVPLGGVGMLTLAMEYNLSGEATLTVEKEFEAGFAYSDGFRIVGNSHKKGFSFSAEADLTTGIVLSAKATLGIVSGDIYAKTGARMNIKYVRYSFGTPTYCASQAAYLYASVGASAKIGVGIASKTFSKSIEIWGKNNSPVRVYYHIEDGVLRTSCTRGKEFAAQGGWTSYWTSPGSRYFNPAGVGSYFDAGAGAGGAIVPIYTYTLDDANRATITGYSGNATALYIPDEIDGHEVVAIGDRAFQNRTDLRTVMIPDSVTEIEAYSFNNCTNLSNVTLSKSLKYMGGRAFGSCEKITQIEIPKSLDNCGNSGYASYHGPFGACSGLKKIIFEEGTKEISNNLFRGCTGLEEISIPASVIKIERYTFADCTNLKNVYFSNGVKNVENNAFTNCTSLTKVNIPDTVDSIGNSAFSGCTNLIEVHLPDKLKETASDTFSGCKKLTTINFPSTLTTIGNSAFSGCESLPEAILPSGVEKIESNAFKNCKALKKAAVPDTVSSIGSSAFYGCEALTDITLGSKLKKIESQTFYGCTVLPSIVLPYNVTTIGDSAFVNCTKLTQITVPRNTTSIASNAFSYPKKMTMYGPSDCYAQTYASGKGIKYVTQDIHATSVSLDSTEKTAERYDDFQLTATIAPLNFTDAVVWTSSNEEVATVSDTGYVEICGVGTAVITVTAGNVKAVCKITVPQLIDWIEFDEDEIELKAGQTYQLKPYISPSDATNKKLKYTSSDTKVAEVSASGLVTAKSEGEAKIRAAATDGSDEYAVCYVTVTGKAKVTGITLDRTSAEVKRGEKLTLNVTASPSYASNKKVVWKSANTKIATVDANGSVTAKAPGRTKITVTSSENSSYQASCTVTVPYKITYKLNKGKNNASNPSTYYGKKVTLKNPSRKGYAFAGWYTDAKFKKKITSISNSAKSDYVLYAKWTKVKVAKASLTSAKNSKSKQILLKYKKVSGAKGYEISYSTDKKFKKAVTKKNTAKTSYTISKLKKGKIYYVRIRAYKMDSTGKKVYGKYSSMKKVKVSK